MTVDPKEALERLKLLADSCAVTGLDHLSVVSRENAAALAFAADLRAVLADRDKLAAEVDLYRRADVVLKAEYIMLKAERDEFKDKLAALPDLAAAAVRAHKPDASFDDSAAGAVERAALQANVADEVRVKLLACIAAGQSPNGLAQDGAPYIQNSPPTMKEG